MSEGAVVQNLQAGGEPHRVVEPSAGELLKRAREAAGLHVAALAVSLKVPVKKLEALENDRLDLLPDSVFARALASSMCRALKIDPAPILDRLPSTSVPRLHPAEHAINTPFHAPGERSHTVIRDVLSKPVFLAALSLLIAALAIVLFPSIQQQVQSQAVGVDARIAEPAGVPLALPESAVESQKPVVDPVSAPLVLAPASTMAQPLESSTAKTELTVPIPPSVQDLVVLRAKGTSWVEVIDSKGVVQLRRTLAAGDTIGASGALPLAVVVGRADNTDIQVRGKDYDVSRYVRDNVARFEVK